MRILLTNDDGIRAEGLRALHRALQDLGEIMTVAPRTGQSATGHGITFADPVCCDPTEVDDVLQGFAVDGRPADCVKLALRALWQERYGPGTKPDLTISGINMGANVGINLHYSGTVAAARESTFFGVPAVAISLHLGGPDATTEYDRAAHHARTLLDRILAAPLDPHTVLNLNLPRTERPDAPLPRLRLARMNEGTSLDDYERRTSPEGQVYYWPVGNGMRFERATADSDAVLLGAGDATFTALRFALTDDAEQQRWARVLGED